MMLKSLRRKRHNKVGEKMNFIEALKATGMGEIVISCQGFIYTAETLQPKRLSNTVYVSKNITTEKERKGEWRILSWG
jgi:exosome complex RNA-binding protein Rrp4